MPAPDPALLARWHVRPARAADLDALLELAALTGGGFTNLPHDGQALAERIAWSEESLGVARAEPEDELYLLVLEERDTGRIGGTASLFSRVGVRWPFYSYKLTTISLKSRELERTFRTEVLHLVNDFDGASEVGGLFLHPDLRAGGLGRLLAKSRYLFIAGHRARFAKLVLAELRGVIDEGGNAPFWDAIAGRFFGMSFAEADRFNSLHGNQFIADLMPKYPVYVALLADDARAVIGQPHPAGRAALALLEKEGFGFHGYVDIFDGGPTVDAPVDSLETVREATRAEVSAHLSRAAAAETGLRLVATGRLIGFRAMATQLALAGPGVAVPGQSGIVLGEEILHARF
ncbi:MAG: arginine N-succinyltransferase [Thermaurantiacus sp.]